MFLFVFSSGTATRKYLSQIFDLSQILSQLNCSDWSLKSKLRLNYLQDPWHRALPQNMFLFKSFFLHDGSRVLEKMKKWSQNKCSHVAVP